MSTLGWLNTFNPDLLDNLSSNDDIYKALGSSDLSDVVVEALKFLNTKPLPEIKTGEKTEIGSELFRKTGNEAFNNKKHRLALILYNKALQYAPADSEAMKLAYSDRSALFMTAKAYGACISDIEVVLDMGCPPEILEKLQNRKQEACEAMRFENCYRKTVPKSDLTFCTLKGVPNALIPSATKNVGFVMENNIPKIIATDNIEVGTVLAIEPAFVSHTKMSGTPMGCYYCHKISYNPVPCEGCCRVLFCNKDCMRDCMKQYHSIECQIINVLVVMDNDITFRMAVKAAIKIKLGCSWEEFIDYTNLFGPERTKKTSIRDIFSHLSPTSMMHFKEERHFIHGAMLQAGFKTAITIHYLGLETGFFPDSNERSKAIKAFARMIMYLNLNGRPVIIHNAISNNNTDDMIKNSGNGFFSFAGKLKMSCLPNVMTVGLNNKVALMAQQPISKGTELTVSPGNHWTDVNLIDDVKLGRQNMFLLLARVCNCVVCSGEWKRRLDTITLAQEQSYANLNREGEVNSKNYPKFYKKVRKAMSDLYYAQFTQQYIAVYNIFRSCLTYYQHVACGNVIIENQSFADE